jgi:hypothetical protein
MRVESFHWYLDITHMLSKLTQFLTLVFVEKLHLGYNQKVGARS